MPHLDCAKVRPLAANTPGTKILSTLIMERKCVSSIAIFVCFPSEYSSQHPSRRYLLNVTTKLTTDCYDRNTGTLKSTQLPKSHKNAALFCFSSLMFLSILEALHLLIKAVLFVLLSQCCYLNINGVSTTHFLNLPQFCFLPLHSAFHNYKTPKFSTSGFPAKRGNFSSVPCDQHLK